MNASVESLLCLLPSSCEQEALCNIVFPYNVTYGFFYFQDSNPFASLVFYWEPLNRQVSEHPQNNFQETVWAGVNLQMTVGRVPSPGTHSV